MKPAFSLIFSKTPSRVLKLENAALSGGNPAVKSGRFSGVQRQITTFGLETMLHWSSLILAKQREFSPNSHKSGFFNLIDAVINIALQPRQQVQDLWRKMHLFSAATFEM